MRAKRVAGWLAFVAGSALWSWTREDDARLHVPAAITANESIDEVHIVRADGTEERWLRVMELCL